MLLSTIDWSIIVLFFIASLCIGIIVSKRAGSSAEEFFLSGRTMPWWLLGVSMVATTFSADTPNLISDIVRKNGVSGNWIWWAFLITGMFTVFVYSKLWRRSNVTTDLEFYEMRYSGQPAAFLRGFRAIYLGVFFNIMIMASVCLAAIKIGATLLGLTPVQTLLIASITTVIYSSLGGLKGVLITDFFQFIIAMIGSVWAAYIIVNLPQVGGLDSLMTHEDVVPKLNFLPDFSNTDMLVTLFVIPIAVQWWSVWYPGAEPGGGGYIAQRMLAAKDEKNAVGATLLFNVAHYALRPWPWLLIALASIIVFPDLHSIKVALPHIDVSIINDDLAYPAMLQFLPHGLLGVVVASLIAAFMSTISTHLNWGSSYISNDFYKRFIKPTATQKELINIGKASTVVLMVISAILALYLESAIQAFQILLSVGAGTGLIFLLRWFWSKINAYAEITAMIVSLLLAVYFELIHTSIGFQPIDLNLKLLMSIGITTISWVLVALFSKPTSQETLLLFYEKIKPAGPGWKTIRALYHQNHPMNKEDNTSISLEILSVFIGCISIYSALFGLGYFLYGNHLFALVLAVVAIAGTILIIRIWNKGQSKH